MYLFWLSLSLALTSSLLTTVFASRDGGLLPDVAMVQGRMYVAAWEAGLSNVQTDIYDIICLATEVCDIRYHAGQPLFCLGCLLGRGELHTNWDNMSVAWPVQCQCQYSIVFYVSNLDQDAISQKQNAEIEFSRQSKSECSLEHHHFRWSLKGPHQLE